MPLQLEELRNSEMEAGKRPFAAFRGASPAEGKRTGVEGKLEGSDVLGTIQPARQARNDRRQAQQRHRKKLLIALHV